MENEAKNRASGDKEDKFKYLVPYRMQTYRRSQGITQAEMAKRIGVTQTYISNIERGITKLPAHILDEYCNILDIPADQFLSPEEGNVGNGATILADIISEVKGLTDEEQRYVYRLIKGLKATRIK